MSVQEYLDKHMLSRKIEDAVNAAVRAKTNDPVLFIVSSSFSSWLFDFVNFDFLIFDFFLKNKLGESYVEIGAISDNEGEGEADPW